MKLIQEIRVSLHARTLDIEKLGVSSRERSLAITTCQQGRMLLGKVLQLLGGETPYPQSDNPGNSVVAPAVDTTVGEYDARLPKEEIPAVKEIRCRMQVPLDVIETVREQIGGLAQATLDAAYTEISLAKNWLGMDLARLAAAPDMPAGSFAPQPPPPVTPPPATPPPSSGDGKVAPEAPAGKLADVVDFLSSATPAEPEVAPNV